MTQIKRSGILMYFDMKPVLERLSDHEERYQQRVESNRRAARARWAAHMTEDMETEEECPCMQTDAI